MGTAWPILSGCFCGPRSLTVGMVVLAEELERRAREERERLEREELEERERRERRQREQESLTLR